MHSSRSPKLSLTELPFTNGVGVGVDVDSNNITQLVCYVMLLYRNGSGR